MDLTKHRVFGLLLALIATASMPSASAQDHLFSNGAKQKAEALLKQMTVDEKVGQLNESSGIVMPGIATEKPDDLIARFGGLSGQTSTNLPPPSPPPATQSTCATPAASNPVGGGGIYTQIAIDPGAYGKRDPSGLTVFGFSQEGQNLPADPQVLEMSPNIVSRAWQRWDRGGVQPSDYNFGYPMKAQAAGIAFIGGTTATALFRDEFPAASKFNAVVSCDATGQPVFHSAMKFYRGSLASPAYRQYLIGIAEMQIDGGVDGLFFDEVDFSYQGATSGNEDNGDEGFDDSNIADFGGFLCGKYPNYSPTDWQSKYGISTADNLNCSKPTATRGRSFNYRGYLARNGWQASPLNRSNPLAAEWGTIIGGHPEPQNGTFTGTYTSLVYWQDIVLTLRNYARQKYKKETSLPPTACFHSSTSRRLVFGAAIPMGRAGLQ